MKYVASKNEKEAAGKKKSPLWIKALTVIFTGVFLFSGYKLGSALFSYGESKAYYNELSDLVQVDIPDDSLLDDPSLTEEQKEIHLNPYELLQSIGADFDALREINSDVVGWITISGTQINYPIAQGSDNDYYLHHLFQGGYNIGGCVFLDSCNSSHFTDKNSILYGHRMDDGSMFTNIQNYKKQSYYEAHPYGMLLTPDGNYVVEFFAGYVTDTTAKSWNIYFYEDSEFTDWIAEVMANSDFQADFTPTASDRVLTLSTCSHAFENARYVLHGVIRSEKNG